MKIAIIIYSADPETIWNAFRLGSASLAYDGEISIFLLSKGVEAMNTNVTQGAPKPMSARKHHTHKDYYYYLQ